MDAGTMHDRTCFVIMPFKPEFDPVMDAIREAVQRIGHGLSCVRLDDLKHGGKISEDLVAALAESALCIADLTGPNPNVMWEAGSAMALKRPMVLISQDTRDLPFDLKDYRVERYNLSDGRKSISLAIEAAIRETLARVRKGNVWSRALEKASARWVAAALVGVSLVALKGQIPARPQPPPVYPPCASSRCDLVHIARGQRAGLGNGVSIELVHVVTLKGEASKPGNAGMSGLSGHAFNTSLSDRKHVFDMVLPGIPEARIAAMSQAEWDRYLKEDLKGRKAARVLDLPFAQFRVYRGVVQVPLEEFDPTKYFFRGEPLEIKPNGLPPVQLTLENVYNTKPSSDELEAVALRVVTKAAGQSKT